MQFDAYYDISAAEHQNRVTSLGEPVPTDLAQRLRGGNARMYAAVWVDRPQPNWLAVHEVDENGFETWLRGIEPDGFTPVLIAVTGTVGNEIFAAVAEHGVMDCEVHHGLINGTEEEDLAFRGRNRIARENGLILRSAAIYGDGEVVRYAGVWHPNPGAIKWNLFSARDAHDLPEGVQGS